MAWLLAYTLMRTGQDAGAAAVADEALARPGISEIWVARLLARQAVTITNLGQMDRAAELAGQALAGAERAGDRFAAGYALHALSLMACLRRDHAAFLRHSERALEVIGDDPQTTDLRLMLLSNLCGDAGRPGPSRRGRRRDPAGAGRRRAGRDTPASLDLELCRGVLPRGGAVG